MVTRGKSGLEEGFATLWRLMANGPEPEREFRFHALRLWRFDFAWPDTKVAVEMEGGVFIGKGGHRSKTNFMSDCEKYNEAAAIGWRVLRFHAAVLRENPAWCVEVVKRALTFVPTKE